jgi:predicted SAM-dependent methyltransferase
MRTLKPGGTIRIVVPDLEYTMSLYQQGNREQALSYFFYNRDLLGSAGLRDVRRCAYQKGSTPDLSCLDRMPEESLFVEAGQAACF